MEYYIGVARIKSVKIKGQPIKTATATNDSNGNDSDSGDEDDDDDDEAAIDFKRWLMMNLN